MADPQLEALIYQLESLDTLLANADQDAGGGIREDISALVQRLKDADAAAISDKEKKEIREKIEALAKSVPLIAEAAISLKNAVDSGDPFAISASVLDLAGSLVATVGAVTGPIGAVVAGVVGAVLSVVSMILKLFIKQPKSLLEKIEEMIDKIESQKKLQGLRAAQAAITSFTAQARATEPETTYSFLELIVQLNPTDGNAIDTLRETQNWLLEADNRELPLWGEVLAVYCQVYLGYKLCLAGWLPHMADANETRKLIDAFATNDPPVLNFLEKVKPVARNRGIIWHSGFHSLYARDVVHSRTAPEPIGGPAGAYFAVSNRAEAKDVPASPHPYIAAVRLGPSQEPSNSPYKNVTGKDGVGWWDWTAFETVGPGRFFDWIKHLMEHPFTKKSGVYDTHGQWPLKLPTKWNKLDPKIIGDCYDIWATTGSNPGEINIYGAFGDRIGGFIHNGTNDDNTHQHLRGVWQTDIMDGHKVGVVRVVHFPKSLPGKDQDALKNVEWAHYGLCEVSLQDKEPFAIQVLFNGEMKGTILPPKILAETKPLDSWRNFPVGMAVDSLRLWVFGTSFIACATHAAVKRCVEEKGTAPAWLTYEMPTEVGGYDPKTKLHMGLIDLSACDDGTLAAVYQNKNQDQLIITATPTFAEGKLGLQPGYKSDDFGNVEIVHGWTVDNSDRAFRAQKQPLFCWSMVEGLANLLNPFKPIRLPRPAARDVAPDYATMSNDIVGVGPLPTTEHRV